ncbi:Metallo-dependent hydrolase [Fistulina hepatica ATCC 64428]|uniref:Metallo-dependent hydrolase n=1 Tax=Fistulina hepatica ATCC 64428 TaxID=1128425 RepID=A0A0D7ALW3_9AGAR|nr:Metallo-dependent hydrolase [Fistulina hepatica ATCC 64428]
MPSDTIAGFAKVALDSLSPQQVAFIRKLPKAELHAHLNGSIPLEVLQDLAREHEASTDKQRHATCDAIDDGLRRLQEGVVLDEIHDFFGLFPAIYALTSTPEAVRRTTWAVLARFLDGDTPECTYMELRSTPRADALTGMTRLSYLEAVLDEVEKYSPEQAGLVVSMDRRMDAAALDECVSLAISLRDQGRRVVGVDLCGSPLAGSVDLFEPFFKRATVAGLGVTLHIAETEENTAEETLRLLSLRPDRLGHATFLNDDARRIVMDSNVCVEICLSSNLLTKTVSQLDVHHILHYLECNHPIAICSDDVLPFRTSLTAEYALLLAAQPLGLGLSENDVRRIAQMSLECRFKTHSK